MGTGLTDVCDAIARAYDLGPVVESADQPVRGLQGQVWRLATTTGTWAVKETFADIDEVEARRWGEFQQQARNGGVPAPAVRPTPTGRHLTRIAGRAFRVYGWVDIEPASADLDPAQVGAAVARLHRVVVPADGTPHWWYTEPVGAATWDGFVEASLAAGAPFAERLAAIRDALVTLELSLTPMAPVQTCHLDLWSDNVRATTGGGLCIIDWDNCGPADPSRELALVVFEFARTDPVRMVALYDAYRAAGGPGRLRAPTDFGMLTAQLGHIGAMHLRRWLDPATSEPDRERASVGIEEFVDDPLTPTVVSRILDALV